jgi:hypothetical protein
MFPLQAKNRPAPLSFAVVVLASASSGAAVQTAILKRKNDPKSNLHEDSNGAIGIDGLNLNWVLNKLPATTVMTAKKNFKLAGGAEVLLRMAPPQM